MIEMLRVDDRLIHGQIAMRWTKRLGVDSIILANDVASKDKTQQTVLKLACPKNLKLAIASIEDAVKLMNDPRLKERKVLTIVNNLDDALALLKAVPDIKIFNIGNYGKNTGKDTGRKLYHLCLMMDDREVEVINEALKLGVTSTVQMLPEDAPALLGDVVKKTLI